VRLLLATLALVSCVMVAGGFLAWKWWEAQRTFSAERWADGADETVGVCPGGDRYGMVEDLRTHHLRVGMKWDEVRALLGKPESQWRERDVVIRDWIVGRTLLFGDCVSLRIRFVDTRVVGSLVAQS
jgi:hypothetical protein